MTSFSPRTFSAAFLALALCAPATSTHPVAAGGGADAVSSIDKKEIEKHVRILAAPGMEGRDSPSEGQRRAAAYISERFRELDLEVAPDSAEVLGEFGELDKEALGSDRTRSGTGKNYLRPFSLRMETPDAKGCKLTLETEDETLEFEFGSDFVPAPSCGGSASGELVFAGYGISSKKQKYNDLKGLRLEDKIALILEGEPRHKKKFDGADHTRAASLWEKLENLNDEGVAGVLLVRRAPEGGEADPDNSLDFRYTHATFAGESEPRIPRKRPPVLEISMDCAARLLGTDAEKLASKMDKSGRPSKVKLKDHKVTMQSATERGEVRLDNVVAVIPGSDPALADEYVLLGAHYDHIGVDPRGRVGQGADDNGSGISALLSITAALTEAQPRRSVLICFFSAEEDGLVGSKEIAKRLPVDKAKIVAMLNMDMVGRGDTDEVVAMGTNQNPDLEGVLKRAKKLSRTGVKKIVIGKDGGLWRRSDQYSFHEIGIPALFFFEGLPISRNVDYHTWRDTPDGVDFEKITRTARLIFNTAWILANDDDRPPPPD